MENRDRHRIQESYAHNLLTIVRLQLVNRRLLDRNEFIAKLRSLSNGRPRDPSADAEDMNEEGGEQEAIVLTLSPDYRPSDPRGPRSGLRKLSLLRHEAGAAFSICNLRIPRCSHSCERYTNRR